MALIDARIHNRIIRLMVLTCDESKKENESIQGNHEQR